jgi:hypothetical protein
LGIRANTDPKTYAKTCHEIDAFVAKTSKEVKHKVINLNEAQRKISQFIEIHDPIQFVNIVNFTKNSIVELTRGGIHHSWEEDIFSIPEGNIVYEVQQDIDDQSSTIRCFDKGKLDEDANPRKLDIDSYFEYIDINKNNNNPKI